MTPLRPTDESTLTLPAGTVTFVVTDIEGSTRLFRSLGDAYVELLDQHHAVLRAAFADNGGIEIKTEGDSLLVAFADAADALVACFVGQQAITQQVWPGKVDVRVRMGVHTGQAEPVAGDYVSIALHQVARISGGAHGGQVLVSLATRDAVAGRLPEGASLELVGSYQLRGFSEPARLYQLMHPDLRAEFPPPRAIGIVEHNLPYIRTNFIGRSEERKSIAEALRRTGVVSIVGAPGVGKTRLAVQVGFDVMDGYADGVWLVELAAASDPAAVGRAVAAVMNVPEAPGRSAEELLVAALADKDAMLILDNCEHLLDAVATLGEQALQHCPRLVILATSREPLDIAGETVWRVEPLETVDVGSRVDAASLRELDAARLFAERASLTRPGFEITDDNATAISEVIAHLNGIPLAIELAAASLGDLSLPALAEGLNDRFSLLTRGRRTAPDRHQTLRAALEWSLDLLPPAERSLLNRMAVFAGSGIAEATAAICSGDGIKADEIPAMLRHLKRSSLLQSSPGSENRWTMLESVRELAAIELEDSGRTPEFLARHSAWFAEYILAAEPRLGRRGSESLMDELAADHDNVRRAIESSIGTNDAATALEIASAMAAFWTSHGAWTEGSERLTAVLAMSGGDETARRRAQVELGSLLLLLGRMEEATHLFLEARSTGEELEVTTARSLAGSGYIAFRHSDLAQAKSLWEQALAHAEQAGDPRVMSSVLRSLAIAAGSSGEQERAGELLDRAIAQARNAQDDQLLRLLLGSSAEIDLWLGNYQTAEEAYGDALDLAARIGDMSARPLLLAELGWIAMLRGDPTTASRLAQEAGELAEDMGNLRVQAHAKRLRAEASLHSGRLDEASIALDEALRAAEELGAPAEIAGVRCSQSGMALELRQYDKAVGLAKDAIELSPMGHPMRFYTPQWVLGCCALAADHTDMAEDHFRAGLNEAKAAAIPRYEANSLWGLAVVDQAKGGSREAARLHWRAYELRGHMGDVNGVASSLVGLASAVASEFPADAMTLVRSAATQRAAAGLVATPREHAESEAVVGAVPDAAKTTEVVADYDAVRELAAKLAGEPAASGGS